MLKLFYFQYGHLIMSCSTVFLKTYSNSKKKKSIHYIKEKYQINHWYTHPFVGNSRNSIQFPFHVNTVFSVLYCSGSPNSSQYSN